MYTSILCASVRPSIIWRASLDPKWNVDPGPKLAAATGLVYCYNVYKGRECAWPTELHKVYGDVVRLGPDRLSYVSPQAWKDIYGPATGSRIENPKDKNHIGTHFNGVDSLTTIPDTETHRNRRRIFNNAFSEKALRLQEPLIRGYVDQMIINVKKVISKEPNAKFDIVRHFNFITFDVMGDLAFGESLGLLQDSAYTPWVKATFTNLKVASLGRLWREYSVLALIMAKVAPPAMKQLAKSHFENAAERVERRIAQGTDIGKPDFWKLVLEKQEKMDYGLEEMKADASTFMRAGTETTATILSGITFLLLKYPAKMQKVLEEIRSLSKEELTLENLPRLPYFNACITEAFRIYPPASTGIPRCIAKGGNAICGEWVPEGVSFLKSHSSICY